MTRLLKSLSSRNLLALGVVTISLAPQVLRAEGQGQCSNATMRGTYVASGTGMVGTSPSFAPIAVVSMVIYNGDGTGVLVYGTTTVGGQTSTASKVPATFTVNPDCTGSKTVGTTNFNFAITPDGSKITWIVTNPGVTLMGIGVRSLFLNSND